MKPYQPGVLRAGPKVVRRYPLAPMQEGMLFQSLLDPGGGLNVEQGLMTLDGDSALETGAFIAAWQQVLDHHEALRTAFRWKAGEPPSQEVVQPVRLPARVEEWGHLSSSEQQRRFDAFLVEDARRGFALDRAPLMRLAIFRLGPGLSRAVLTIHHLLYDGRSIIRLYQQAFEAYRGLIAAKPITLPPSPPYSDFVAWLHQNSPSEAESYWRGLLAGFQELTPLGFGPTGYTDHPDQSPVDTIVQPLDSDLVRNLWKLANALDITPNTIIQGAWAILLSRYSGQTDVVWGNTRAGRKGTVRDADQMMGMFINTVPVRISVAGNADLADWLKRLRRQQLDVRPFQHSSLSDIQRWSDMSDGARLYQTLVAVEYFVHERRVARACSRVLPMALRILGRTGLPLTLMVGLGEDAQWELLFEKSQVTRDHAQRMLRHLGTLLAEMVRNPRLPIADLSHLSADRRRKLLVDMNPAPRPYPRDATIHQLFDERARSHPDATALIEGERILTYGQLRRQSDRLAYHLRELGVTPRDPVAVHLGRSLELVVAFLGILKAGGCYLPLDTFSPDIRQGYLIYDSKAELLITDQPGLPAFASVPPTILRPEDWPMDPEAPSLPPDGSTSAEDPAYIIYTSGSTGDPKGVVVPHRGVVRLVFNHYLPFEAGLTFLMLAAPSFDASTLEIWAPLLRSGVCAICRPALPRPRELQRLLSRSGVNCLWLTAALFNTIIDNDPRTLASVDYLMVGGEALSVDHVRRALKQLPGTRIINGYGPTENTTFTCTFPIPPTLDPRG
ncbi:MAG: AMP-binding protein, partial [Deltaproteobacteria bacterium]|nr:AMP-binding protein [Deltaproteobacteria bacterium]